MRSDPSTETTRVVNRSAGVRATELPSENWGGVETAVYATVEPLETTTPAKEGTTSERADEAGMAAAKDATVPLRRATKAVEAVRMTSK